MSESNSPIAAPAWLLVQLRMVLNAQEMPELEGINIPGLIEVAEQQMVAPYLYWKLGTLGVPLDEPAWQPLGELYQTQCERYRKNRAAAQVVQATLHHAHIPALWLKGFALAHSVYPNPMLRPMSDLDVLVPFAERERALECLERLGYSLQERLHSPELQDLWHHYQLLGPTIVELHYALLAMQTKLLPRAEMEWFWQHTQTLHDQELEWTAFAPEAEFLYLCAHALLQHGENDFTLQRALDLHLLLEKNPTMDWDLILERATKLGWLLVVTRALELTRDYFDAPVPERALNALYAAQTQAQVPPEAGETLATATRSEKTLTLLHQMDRTRQWHWVVGSLFPRPGYVRQRYGVRENWKLPLYYLYRWLVMGQDVVQTMLKWANVGAKHSPRD